MLYRRPAWAEIDLGAVRANLRQTKTLLTGKTKLCAVIKADAYGHGALAAAREALAAGADYLAVAVLGEALELREAGLTCPVLILGYTPPHLAPLVVGNRLTQTVYDVDLAQSLSAAAVCQGVTVKVHLKIDTGMGRLGINPDDTVEMTRAIKALPGLELEGVFTHFAKADCLDREYTHKQLALFNRALAAVKECGIDIPLRHCANSAATVDYPEAHFDMVRVGILLYGLWPSDEVSRKIKLTPAMSLKVHLAQVKTLPAGSPISYGGTFVTQAESRIATLPIGYADGWSRLLSGKASVIIDGQRAPIVGRICMDQCMADVTMVPGAISGAEALLFGGPHLPAEEVAEHLGSINYEVICMVGKKLPRVYRG